MRVQRERSLDFGCVKSTGNLGAFKPASLIITFSNGEFKLSELLFRGSYFSSYWSGLLHIILNQSASTSTGIAATREETILTQTPQRKQLISYYKSLYCTEWSARSMVYLFDYVRWLDVKVLGLFYYFSKMENKRMKTEKRSLPFLIKR